MLKWFYKNRIEVIFIIERKEYLEALVSFKDKNLIKVITGIRRCGKSTMFELFKNISKIMR